MLQVTPFQELNWPKEKRKEVTELTFFFFFFFLRYDRNSNLNLDTHIF
jgi:hypothetical protein